MADPTKPWIWVETGPGGWNLVDVDYYYLAFVNRVTGYKDGDPNQPMEIPSKGTLARIAVVPLMEELLREEIEAGRKACPSPGTRAEGEPDTVMVACGKCRRCRIVGVLARIDSAKV